MKNALESLENRVDLEQMEAREKPRKDPGGRGERTRKNSERTL